jgi:hypothetical protein
MAFLSRGGGAPPPPPRDPFTTDQVVRLELSDWKPMHVAATRMNTDVVAWIAA